MNAVISTNKNTQIITGHVIYLPAYTYKFQLKTTKELVTTAQLYIELGLKIVGFLLGNIDD